MATGVQEMWDCGVLVITVFYKKDTAGPKQEGGKQLILEMAPYLNRLRISTTEETFQPEISPLKTLAPLNVAPIFVTEDVSQVLRSLPRKEVAPANILFRLVTLDKFHVDKFPSNAAAPWNIFDISVTWLVSHPDRSSLKVFLPWNNPAMSVTFPTHHEFMGQPYFCAMLHPLLLVQSKAM